MDLKHKFHLFNNLLNSSNALARNAEDIYCLQLLNRVLNEGRFIPMTSMSLRPYVLAFLLNEMVINKRKSVIEFGAGISTILLARMAKMLSISPKIVSIEQDPEWCQVIDGMLKEEGLEDKVTLLHIPVEEKKNLGVLNHWYQEDILRQSLKGYGKFDMVIIDGPTAYNDQLELSRFHAIPFLQGMFNDNHVIFLDDANRKGEKKVMELWKKEFGKVFKIYGDTLGVFRKNEYFESNPMKFVPF